LPLTSSYSASAPHVSIGAGCERGKDHVLLDDDVGAREGGRGRGRVAGLPVEDVVALVLAVVADDGRAGLQRAARVHDRLERLVLDIDQLERVARGVVVVGNDERDLLALEAHFVGREHGLAVGRHRGHPRHAARLEVAAGDDGVDLRERERGGGVDRDDARVGERAAQDRAVQRARAADVVEEAPCPRMKRASSLRRRRPKPIGRSSAPAAVPVRSSVVAIRCARSSSSACAAGRRPATRR
jgi:hypothetical protein